MLQTRDLLVSLAVVLSAGPAAAGEQDGLGLVRLISAQEAPPEWLQLEERVLERLGHESFGSLVSASVAADTWGAPGFRFDRARSRIRAALTAIDDARSRGASGSARRQIQDCEDLLRLDGVVAVMPQALLRRFHRAAALVGLDLGGRRGRQALQAYLALSGVSAEQDAELDSAAVERAVAELDDLQPAGITIEVAHRGAVVYLDGERIGTGSTRRYDLRPGVHYLRVMAPGHRAHGERLSLAPGKIARRTVKLSAASGSLSRRGEALARAKPPGKELERLQELAANLGTPSLLLMMRAPEGGARLRHVDLVAGTFGTLVAVALDGSDGELERALLEALGRAPPELESIPAAPATASPADSVTTRLPTDGEGGIDKRWLWVGAGAALVVGVVVTIALVAGGDDEPRAAPVWLCPGGDPCAP
jgi:hypothetical protein